MFLIYFSELLVLVCAVRTMTQGELELLCGPWQKDRRRQDERQHHQDTKARQMQQRSSQSRGPEARAQRHGPSAARAAATGPRPGARYIAACNLEAETRGIAWKWPAAAPYWLKFRYRKLENFSYWIKMPFRLFQRETAMKAVVICSILYNA